MKNELIHLCQELENNFDEKLERYEDRLDRLNDEIGLRLFSLSKDHPEDDRIDELKQFFAQQKRTLRLMQAKLKVIHNNSKELFDELDIEVKDRLPGMRQKIEDSPSYEQAEIEINQEAHSGSDSFNDFIKALFMWRETPEEKVANKR